MWKNFRSWFRKSTLKSWLKKILPDSIIRKGAYFYNEQWKKERENISPMTMLGFETHVVEHCNLNCSSCCHFSPLAREEYLDPSIFEKDCKRISELTNKLRYLRILGGEPLLHPKINEFFDIARKYFPGSIIQLTTNGILSPKMPDIFWENCIKMMWRSMLQIIQ